MSVIENILPNIISYLNSKPELSSLGGRIISPEFNDSQPNPEPMPKLALSQEGGSKRGNVKIFFTVRATTIKESRELSVEIINLLCSEYDVNDNIKWIELTSGIFDSISKVGGYPESSFFLEVFLEDH